MDPESEYNNRARVPEHPAVMQGWQRDASAWREACPRAELGLAYGGGGRERLDLFWPEGEATAMAVFIHGGYWMALGREWASHCARGLNGHGVAVAIPSYDLVPTVTIGTIVAQMRAACAFLHRRHGVRLMVMGHSAGGQLAAMMLATDWRALDPALPADLVPAALPISGVFELEPLLPTSIGAALGITPAEARAQSPRFLPEPGGTMHCVVGAEESPEYLRQTRDMAEAWGGTAEALPGANHFTVIAPLADPASALMGHAKALACRR